MKLLIFSYPRHFHIMQLAYKHALTVFENIDKVYIMWDDLYQANMLADKIPQYLPDVSIIPYSNLEHARNEPSGWLRQQYIKLNLHKLFDDNEWIILDADTILRSKKILKVDNKRLFYTDESDHYQPYYDFIEHAFDIRKENSPSFMTHFALFERDVLESMEMFCLKKHNKDLISLFKEFYKNNPLPGMCSPLSEFETYGLFASKIMKREFLFPQPCYTEDDPITSHPKKNAIWDYTAGNFIKTYYTTNRDMCLRGADTTLPKGFYRLHNIVVQEELITNIDQGLI